MTVLAEKQTKTASKMPDGPKTPRWLATIRGILDPLKSIEKAAETYGDIYTSRFAGFPPQVVVSNPQAIQEIFTADPKLFESGEGNKILQSLTGDYSLLLHDGDYHQRQRRLLTPPFHGERMRAYGKLICDITEQVMNQQTIGKPFSARSSMQEISLRVIFRVVFGLDEEPRFQQLRQLLCSILDTFNSPLSSSLLFIKALQQDLGPWSPWGRFVRRKQQIDKLLCALIRDRRTENNSSREDILSLMMSARDEAGEPMTDAELRDELMTLLFAGHETTATALAWALYWIHYLPQVREKLLQELDALGDNPDPDIIARLPYLNAVCCETLRIYPVGLFTFARIVRSPLRLMGYELEPGTVLAPCIYLTHHREEIYPEPKRFQPERFLKRQFSAYEFFPFGGGNRRCIGLALAQYEMKLVLATILRTKQLALVDRRPIKPVRRGITMAPAGGVRIVVTSSR